MATQDNSQKPQQPQEPQGAQSAQTVQQPLGATAANSQSQAPENPAKTATGTKGVPGHTAKPADASKRVYSVEDKNAGDFKAKRTHTIKVPGRGGKDELKSFTFEPNTPLEMPQDYALRFLEIDPAFIVRNSKGAIIRPRNQADPKDRVVTVKPHEMVVPLTAVLKQHLFEIAQTLPGGDRYTSVEKVDREELEEFIITGGKVDEDDLIDDEDA